MDSSSVRVKQFLLLERPVRSDGEGLFLLHTSMDANSSLRGNCGLHVFILQPLMLGTYRNNTIHSPFDARRNQTFLLLIPTSLVEFSRELIHGVESDS